MPRPTTFTSSRYLLSKRTVDDRALNRGVFEHLARKLRARPRVLEIGAGAGTMVARALEWGLFTGADYTLLDVDGECLATARSWIAGWAGRTGRSCQDDAGLLRLAPEPVTVRLIEAELGAHMDGLAAEDRVDLLIANAFLDLVDVSVFLPSLLALVAEAGLFWFTINFDGETIFLPEHPLDGAVLGAYHRDMDDRVSHGRPAGDSKTGRRLFGHLALAGATVLAAGSSDWVVFPQHGQYPADESYFLHHIVNTISSSLSARREVEPRVLQAWVELRHDQVERGELTYIAHQLDFLGHPARGRCPGPIDREIGDIVAR
jgi:SAM-dependent methyltransferase